MAESEKQKSKLLKLLPSGDGVIQYSSGNLAVIVCKQPSGQLITFMSDSPKSKVLANLSHLGEGVINYPSGKPWVVLTSEGYIVSDRKGNITERGKWPRVSTDPVVCGVNECLVVNFLNKQDITARFNHEDVAMSWQCGEQLRRTTSYTSGAVTGRKGKVELDVEKIRRRQEEQGSLYVSPGPRQQPTELPGIGGLRVTLRKELNDPQLGATIDDLRTLDDRMLRMQTNPSLAASFSSSMRSTSSRSALSSSGGSMAALEDYGSPALSEVQRHYMPTMRTPNPNTKPVNYKLRRRRLARLDVGGAAWEEQVIGAAAPSDTIVFLCVLADYNPLCARVGAQLEQTCFDVAEAAAANSAAELARVQMLRVDAAQSSALQDRYGFRSVPMFLMFYEGKLVWTSNNLRTAEDARRAALQALLRGRKKEFLPEGFKAQGLNDNELLDFLKPDMSLMG